MQSFPVLLAVLVVSSTASAQWLNWGSHNLLRSSDEVGNCPDSCRQPMDKGYDSCNVESSKRWFYNTETQKCEAFQYSGCGESPNNFEAKNDCAAKCHGCSRQNLTSSAVSHQPKCDCNFVKQPEHYVGGCKIVIPAPEGYKCHCTITNWRWTCHGEALPCNSEEHCPSQCTTRQCCITAQGEDGNCNGYPRRPEGADNTTRHLEQRLERLRECLAESGVLNLIFDQASNAVKYDILNHQWNERIEKIFPLAYFVPKTTVDVQFAVKCGVKTNVHVIPNSGAHSYEAISFGTKEIMVIDFREMKGIAVDAAQRTATLEPGNLVGPITAHLWKQGGFGVPMGNCMTVGIGGHAIGGGIGYYSTVYGLTVDNVLEFTMVDAEGNVRVVNPNQNTELWWALRGMGPGYIGIITKVKLRVFHAKKASLTWVKLRWDVEHYVKVMTAFQNWLTWTDENQPTVFTAMFITGDGFPPDNKFPPADPGITVHLLHIKDVEVQPEDNTIFLQQYPKFFPVNAALNSSVTNPSYLEFVVSTGYAPVNFPRLTNPKKVYPIGRIDDPIIHKALGVKKLKNDNPEEVMLQYLMSMRKEIAAPRYFKARTFFVRDKFGIADLTRVFDVLKRIPNHSIWLMYSSETGAIQNHSSTENAYVHRRELYDMSVHHEGPNEPDKVHEANVWMEEFWNTIQFMDGGQTYQNYPDLDVKDFLKRHYAENLPKLLATKKKYDPTNYFRNPLSIPVNLK